MWSGVRAWHDARERAPRRPARASRRPVVARPGPGATGTPAPTRSSRSAAPNGCCSSAARPAASRWRTAVARTGRHPSDALADWLLATDLDRATSARPTGPSTTTAAVEVLRARTTLSGASDAGRARPDVQRRRRRHVPPGAPGARPRYACSIEEAVHARHRQAGAVLRDPRPRRRAPGRRRRSRGLRARRARARAPRCRRDRPPRADAWRYGRTPGGYRATIVAGTPTWLDGAATGPRPGTMLERLRSLSPRRARSAARGSRARCSCRAAPRARGRPSTPATA